jgi:hypothetical protein
MRNVLEHAGRKHNIPAVCRQGNFLAEHHVFFFPGRRASAIVGAYGGGSISALRNRLDPADAKRTGQHCSQNVQCEFSMQYFMARRDIGSFPAKEVWKVADACVRCLSLFRWCFISIQRDLSVTSILRKKARSRTALSTAQCETGQ